MRRAQHHNNRTRVPEYLAKRANHKESAKRSRDVRKAKQEEVNIRIKFLEQEIPRITNKIKEETEEVERLRRLAESLEFRLKRIEQVKSISNNDTNENMRRAQHHNNRTRDPEYLAKRANHKESAKRSRDVRKAKQEEVNIRIKFLEQEIPRITNKIKEETEEVERLRRLAESLEFRLKRIEQVKSISNNDTNENMRRAQHHNNRTRDPEYLAKRAKPKESAKRSRDVRKAKQEEVNIRIKFLEQEIPRITNKIKEETEEVEMLRRLAES
ncbi:uncharacterized protein, partial [Euwallacea similis]|uniref:uncharacterized protein n=1 Tax=Euwallacea similis TaxID=1736056 RepID=UPI00345053D8